MPSPSPEALLEHVGFLRAVARGILRNEADAEDVVQQTLVAALEKPPPDDRNLKGWLAAVARNVARMQFRSGARRREREAKVARADATPSTDEITARLEMERNVVDAVSTLEEPFRTTVILRYYDGLSPKEIAERFGIPAATVRTRLKRGLEKMRGDLETSSGGRRRMLAGLLLLAQLPAQAASPWPARLVAGGGVAAVIVCVLTVAWLARDADRPPRAAERTIVVGEVESGTTDPATATADAPQDRPSAVVRGAVVDRRDAPVAGAEVIALPHDGPGRLETPATRVRRFLARPSPLARARTDGRGRYELALPKKAPVWIVARKDGHLIDAFPLLDATGSWDGADLRIPRSEGVRGVLVDGDGEPLRGVFVHGWDWRFAEDFTAALAVAKTDADGAFRLPFPPETGPEGAVTPNPVTLVVDAREHGYLPRVLRDRKAPLGTIALERGPPGKLETEPGATAYLFALDRFAVVRSATEEYHWPDSATRFSAFVLHPDHAPAVARWRPDEPCRVPLRAAPVVEGETPHAGAEVGLRPEAESVDQAVFGLDCLRATVADKAGRYRIRGRGTAVLAHPDLDPDRSPSRSAGPARSVTGRVVDERGNPVAGARVEARPPLRDDLSVRLVRRHVGNWIALTRPDGRFEIRGLPRDAHEKVTLVASHPGRRLRGEGPVDAGTLRAAYVHLRDVTDWGVPARVRPVHPSVRDPNHALEGWVVDRRGLPVRDAEVSIDGDPDSTVRTDMYGAYRIPVPGKGRYVLVVRKEGVGSGRFPWDRTDDAARLMIPLWTPFTGRVLHRGGPVEGAFVVSFVEGRLHEHTRTDEGGRFVLAEAPFDRAFTISISHAGFLTVVRKNPVDGDFELERAAAVRIRVLGAKGRPAAGVDLVVDGHPRRTNLDGHVDVHREKKDGMTIALGRAGQGWILGGPVEWSGDGAIATVRIRRGLRIEGEVRDAENRPVPHILVLAEPVEEGPPVRRAFTNAKGRFVLRTLHPARYRLRVAEERAFEIVEAGRTDVVLRKEAR